MLIVQNIFLASTFLLDPNLKNKQTKPLKLLLESLHWTPSQYILEQKDLWIM